MSLHQKAADGTLDRRTLNNQPTGYDIDEADSARGWTPLAYAVANSKINVVKLLVQKGASLRRKTSGSDHQTLLHLAVASKERDALAVTKYLIQQDGQRIDEPAAAPPNDTPLMTAIRQGAEPAIIQLLKDSGASTTVKNSNGESAQDIANNNSNTQTKKAIQPKEERESGKTELADFLAALGRLGLYHLKPFQNIRDAAIDAIGQLGREYGKTPSEMKKLPPNFLPKSVEEFRLLIRDVIEEEGLEDVIPPNSDLIDEIAEKGVDNIDHPDVKGKGPDEIRDLIRCALYQPLIYLDDSGSMKGERIEAAKEICERVATLMAIYSPDGTGCHLRYINQDGSSLNHLDGPDLGEKVEFDPNGWTPLGTGFRNHVLNEFIYEPISSKKEFDRPLLIITISDGAPNKEDKSLFQDEMKQAGLAVKAAGYQPCTVKYLVSQVGDDGEAVAFLDGLRGLRASDPLFDEILHVTSDRMDGAKYKELRDNRKDLDAYLIKHLGPWPRKNPQP